MANAIAPEHLQLMVPDEEGLALLDLVQNAGAVFIGDWSPASVGDYVAGPNHVLPTNRTARFASALRADDFRKHVHAVPGDARRVAHPRPARRDARRDRGAARPRRLRAAPSRRCSERRSCGERRPAGAPRPGAGRGVPLPPGRRGGPPQHERVTVRAAGLVARRVARGLGGGLVPPLPGPCRHGAAPGVADRHGVSRGGGLLRQRLERGPAEPAAGLRGTGTPCPPLRADLRPALAHRAASPAPRWSRAHATTSS